MPHAPQADPVAAAANASGKCQAAPATFRCGPRLSRCHRSRRPTRYADMNPSPSVIAGLLLAVFALGSARLIAQAVREAAAGFLQPPTWPVAMQIGRASCRERVCQSVWVSGVGVSLKK